MIKGSDPASKRETGEHRDAIGGGRHTIETDDCGDGGDGGSPGPLSGFHPRLLVENSF